MASSIVRLPLFNAFVDFTPVLPNYYWNVYSSEERIKAICEELCKLIAYANSISNQTNINTDDIEALQADFEKFKESGFEDYYDEQITKWINENAGELIVKLTRTVYFGLTTDGHFVAYIPESWKDIEFGTSYEYGTESWGRLVLSFDVDSPQTDVIQDGRWLHDIELDIEPVWAGLGGN